MLEVDTRPDPNAIGDASAPNSSAPGANAPRADYSLGASGKTYIERAKEARDIVDRIKTSSASVIGIAGVRGAGKSSLAKKVLGECDAAGFFTLLIPSPTKSDPKEFLLAIFQRIGEHATEKVQTVIEGAESLAELGNHHARQLRRQLYVVFCGLVFLGLISAAGAYWAFAIEATAKNEIQLKGLDEKRNFLNTLIDERQQSGSRPVSPTKDKDNTPTSTYSFEISRLTIDTLHQFKLRMNKVPDAALGVISSALEEEIGLLKKIPDFEVKFLFKLGAIVIIVLFGTLIGLLLAITVYKNLQNSNKYRIEIGLRYKCRAFMELIKYQSVLKSKSEFTVAPKFLSFFSGKFSNSKHLEDRPLSLPGLTATCCEFLGDVAKVFSGKVVICIDELDKITDIAELFELLKGIKGILGQEDTHFILTVSEDAMAFFNERLSRERTLVESSFEEIVYLDRLNRDVTNKVIRRSLGVTESNSKNFLRNSAVQWLFAGGIPREIKRNLFTSFSQNISMNDNSSVELWRLLYLRMLYSMLAMSTPKEAGGMEDQYRFLICIETLIDRVEALPNTPDFRNFMREVLGTLRLHFGSAFRPLLFAHPANSGKHSVQNVKSETASSSVYFAQLVEALIGAIILAIANNDIIDTDNDDRQLNLLIYVYKYIPINPQYAFYGLNRFLETKLNTLEINLNDLLAEPPTSRLAVL